MNEFLQRLRERKLVQWALAYVAFGFADAAARAKADREGRAMSDFPQLLKDRKLVHWALGYIAVA
jgi:hypothetical protein